MEISSFSRRDADEILSGEEALSASDRSALLDLTHPPDSPPLILSVSSDILYKLGAISYFGLWDMDTGRQETSLYLMASRSSMPCAAGTDLTFDMNGASGPLQIRLEDGGARILADSSSVFANANSLSLWENGSCVFDQDLDGTGASVILLKDGDRLSAFACNPELKESVLVRLFVCGDTGLPGAEPIGSWYSGVPSGETPTQSLLNYSDSSAWGIRLWRLTIK